MIFSFFPPRGPRKKKCAPRQGRQGSGCRVSTTHACLLRLNGTHVSCESCVTLRSKTKFQMSRRATAFSDPMAHSLPFPLFAHSHTQIFCNQSTDTLSNSAGLHILTVYVGVVECVPVRARERARERASTRESEREARESERARVRERQGERQERDPEPEI